MKQQVIEKLHEIVIKQNKSVNLRNYEAIKEVVNNVAISSDDEIDVSNTHMEELCTDFWEEFEHLTLTNLQIHGLNFKSKSEI